MASGAKAPLILNAVGGAEAPPSRETSAAKAVIQRAGFLSSLKPRPQNYPTEASW